MTVSEATLWIGIRRRSTGARFRRQVPIGPWIVDFASFDPRIVIEVDDSSHEYRDERQRSAFIRDQGFTILRYDNEQVARHYDSVIDDIRHEVKSLRHQD